MKIYTGTGDAGETGLFGGQRVSKDDLRVEAYGTTDEVNAALGLAASYLAASAEMNADLAQLRDVVENLQRELFMVGADLATPLMREAKAGKQLVTRVTGEDATQLEALIDRYEAQLVPLRQFILPGGTLPASALHHARTVTRRAERCVVTFRNADPEGMNMNVIRYLNRLADLLFVLARAANHYAGVNDVPWTREDNKAKDITV